MKDYNNIELDARDDICRITINKPMDRNALDWELIREIEIAITKIEGSKARAVVFYGGGDSYFIGGTDGVEMMTCNTAGAGRFSYRLQQLFNRMESSPLIIVAAIDGLCFGGGFEFALACDFRVASKQSRIGLPEVKVGLIPGGGGTQRLPALVGTGVAMEMILSGTLYGGTEALEKGLIHRCTAADGLDAGVMNLLRPVLERPAHAVSLAKRSVNAYQHSRLFQNGLRMERDLFSRCFQEDFFRSLMEKQLETGELKSSKPWPEKVGDDIKESPSSSTV